MPKVEVEVSLTEEDRKLLKGVTAAAKLMAGATPKKPAKDEDADEDADEIEDADADAEADEEFEAEDEADAEDGLTRDDVQTALRAYATATSKADAVKLMKAKGGTEALSKLAEGKFKAVIDAANAATKKAKKK